MKSRLLSTCVALFAFGIVSHVNAAINIADIDLSFRLLDHPDGAIRLPTYGLRLDGLQGDTSKEYTFSFDPSAATGVGMRMDIDLDSAGGPMIWIHGRAYGGEDTGSGYGTEQGLFDIDFMYAANVVTNGVTSPGNEPNLKVQPKSSSNSGTISFVSGSGTWSGNSQYNFVDEAPGTDASFFFEYGDHRLPNTDAPDWEGWGWVTHDGYPNGHVYSSDWLFTAERVELPPPPTPQGDVPEPASAAVWLALTAVCVVRRRSIA